MQNEHALVSVLVQTYQHVHYIRQCLESILRQKTNFSFEIIIGEDCSTDGTREICQEFASLHPDKIKLVLRDRKNVIYINNHATGRFNFMQNILSAKGKYIAFCEGDDYWTNDTKLQQQIDFLESNLDYVMSFHNAIIDHERKALVKKKYFHKKGKLKNTFSIEDTFEGWFIPTASIVYRRPVDFTFPEWFSRILSSDIALTSLLAQHGKIGYIDEYMSAYRINSGGISNKHRGSLNLIISRIEMYQHLNRHYNFAYSEHIQKGIRSLLFDNAAEMLFFAPVQTLTRLFQKIKKQFSRYLIH